MVTKLLTGQLQQISISRFEEQERALESTKRSAKNHDIVMFTSLIVIVNAIHIEF